MFTVKDNEIVIGQNFTSNHNWEPNNCGGIKLAFVYGPKSGKYLFI